MLRVLVVASLSFGEFFFNLSFELSNLYFGDPTFCAYLLDLPVFDLSFLLGLPPDCMDLES